MAIEIERFIREKERRRLTGVSTSSWYEMQQHGTAPRPVKIGQRAVAWLLSDLISWQQQRIAESVAGADARARRRPAP